MTASRRRAICQFFREQLDTHGVAKLAIKITRDRFRIGKSKPSRSSIYRWCAELGVKTK